MNPQFSRGCQFALTLEGAQTYFWSSCCCLFSKDKQAKAPLKRLFGQCLVPDECGKQRSAHTWKTRSSVVYAFGAVGSRHSKGWRREGSEEGEVAAWQAKHSYWPTLQLQKSHKMHEMQSGNKLQKKERDTEKSKHVHLPLYRSIPPPLPFIQSGRWVIWAVSAERQLEQTEKVEIHIHTCPCTRSSTPSPFFIESVQWTLVNEQQGIEVTDAKSGQRAPHL